LTSRLQWGTLRRVGGRVLRKRFAGFGISGFQAMQPWGAAHVKACLCQVRFASMAAVEGEVVRLSDAFFSH
jgi:hypothetical protein